MKKLLFVYNADSGMANALLDTGRRIFRPQDYPCALCKITYGPFGKSKDWELFVSQLPYEASFIHKDELPALLQAVTLSFPCLILLDQAQYDVLIDGPTFSNLQNLEALKHKVTEVLGTGAA